MSDSYSFRILIVEDDPLIAEDLSGMVSDLGYEVVGKAFSAESALLKIKNLQPDLILLDIELSGDMTGIEVAEIINTTHKGLPFIFITSYYDDQTVSRAKKTNPSGYLLKPFDERDIKVALTLAIGEKVESLAHSSRLYIRTGNKLESVEIASVSYIKADDNYCELYTCRLEKPIERLFLIDFRYFDHWQMLVCLHDLGVDPY